MLLSANELLVLVRLAFQKLYLFLLIIKIYKYFGFVAKINFFLQSLI